MPKIVDHKAHSQDLAQRAAKYFSDHGYAGTSMRKVAAYLGLSKSALYHYFPTKEHLFLACTRLVMGGLDRTFIDATASDEENLAQLKEVLRKDFASEMTLVFEYLWGKSGTEIANDEAMQVAMDAYRKMVASIVGEDEAEEHLARLFGSLMLDYMSGR